MSKKHIKTITVVYWLTVCVYGLYRLIVKRPFVSGSDFYVKELSVSSYVWFLLAFIFAGVIVYYSVAFFLGEKKTYKWQVFVITLVCYATVLIVISLARYYEYSEWFLGFSDERNIYNLAVSGYPFSFVYTSFIYMVGMILFPLDAAGVILLRILFSTYVVSYVIYRINRYYNTYLGWTLLILFMQKLTLNHQVELHRMEWYAFVYLLFVTKLWFDYKEKVNTKKDFYFQLLLMSILTVLRREGGYLFIFGTMLLLIVYQISKTELLKYTIICLIVNICVYLPPFFDAKLSGENLVSEGFQTASGIYVWEYAGGYLDSEKCPKEWEIANSVLDFNQIDDSLIELGEGVYRSCWWMANGDNYSVREGVSEGYFKLLTESVPGFIIKNPVGFITSRINGFMQCQNEDKENLLLAMSIIILLFIWAIYKQDMVLLLITLCLLCHGAITIATMPRYIFKYFYEIYIIGWAMGYVVAINMILCAKRIDRSC